MDKSSNKTDARCCYCALPIIVATDQQLVPGCLYLRLDIDCAVQCFDCLQFPEARRDIGFCLSKCTT